MKKIFLSIILSFLFVSNAWSHIESFKTMIYILDLEKGSLTITALPGQMNEVVFEPGVKANWEVLIKHTSFLLDNRCGYYSCVVFPSPKLNEYHVIDGGFICFLGGFSVSIKSTKENQFRFYIMNPFDIPMEVEISLQ